MKNQIPSFLHFRPRFKLSASSSILLFSILVKFISTVQLSNSQVNNQTHHQLSQFYSSNRTHQNSVLPFVPDVFLKRINKRINNEHQSTNDQSSSSSGQIRPNHQSTSPNHPEASGHPAIFKSNHLKFPTSYHQTNTFSHPTGQLEPASFSYPQQHPQQHPTYQGTPSDYPTSLAAAEASQRANYQSLKASVHNQIRSNFRQFNNRKYEKSKRREDRQTDEDRGRDDERGRDEEPGKDEERKRDEERAEEEKYSTEYNDEDGNKNAPDYEAGLRTNRQPDEESKPPNEKTDYRPDYDTEDDPQRGRQKSSEYSKESDQGRDYSKDSRESGSDSSRDYDERKADEDSVHMPDDDSPPKDDPKEDLKEDEESADERAKEDDDFKDDDTFKNEENENKDSATDSPLNRAKDSVALRFLPIPKYSRPFTPKKERSKHEPRNEPKYEPIDEPINQKSKFSRSFGESSNSFGEMDSFDEKTTKPGFGGRSKFLSDDEKSLPDDLKEKEVNYSAFGLNPINLESHGSPSGDHFERNEELLIELLKRRFLNSQKRMLELKKQEKRRQFLNEIDESFSIRQLNQEAEKYAAVERKLNRLINLIQAQQNQRELTRFTSQPTMGSLWTDSPAGRAMRQPTRKLIRSKFAAAASANLFGPNAHLYPWNRLPLSRPFASWPNQELPATANQPANYESSNNLDYRLPANYAAHGYRAPYYSAHHSANYRPTSNGYRSGLKENHRPAGYKASYVAGRGNTGDGGNVYGSYGNSYISPSVNPSINPAINPSINPSLNPYVNGVYQPALASALNSVTQNVFTQSPSSPPNHPVVKRYPIYKFIRPIEQAVEQATSNRKLTPLNERLNSLNSLSLNNLSLNSLLLNNLFGGAGGDKNAEGNSNNPPPNNQAKTTPTNDLIGSILQSASESTGFRKLAPNKYQYRLLHRLSPAIPLRDRSINDG